MARFSGWQLGTFWQAQVLQCMPSQPMWGPLKGFGKARMAVVLVLVLGIGVVDAYCTTGVGRGLTGRG